MKIPISEWLARISSHRAFVGAVVSLLAGSIAGCETTDVDIEKHFGLFFLLVWLCLSTPAFLVWCFQGGVRVPRRLGRFLVQRALRRAQTVRVGDLKEGQIVRVKGQVRCIGEPLVAPLSSRRCAQYQAVVTSDNQRLIDEQRQVDFLLDDGTGRARIAMDEATVATTMEKEFPAEKVDSFLAAHQRSRREFIFEWQFTPREGVVEVGGWVTVLGLVQLEPDPHPDPDGSRSGYRDVPLRPVIVAPRYGRLLLSDDRATLPSGEGESGRAV